MTPGELVAVGARAFGVSVEELRGSKRGAVSQARYGVAWALRQRFGQSYESIGRLLGKRHATIHEGLARANCLRAKIPEFRARTDRLLTIDLKHARLSRRQPPALTHRVKPKNEHVDGDSDARMRLHGTLALERALLAARGEAA